MSTGRPAVFLDRDGTIIEDAGYLDRLGRLQFFPWSVDAIRLLNQAGYLVVVITNQAGVAQGFFDESFVSDAHQHIDRVVTRGGGRIAGYYYCPHHPNAALEQYRRACDCRKPAPGMVLRAAEELGIDLSRSFMVGDKWIDVQVGTNVGAQGILVRTGYGETQEQRPVPDVTAAAVVDNLLSAVTWILEQEASVRQAAGRDPGPASTSKGARPESS